MKPEKTGGLFFSREIYSEEAVRLAAAVFEGRAEVLISKKAGGTAAEVSGPGDPAGDFANEVLNQQCRIDLGRKNARLASLISTKALLSAAGEKLSKRR